MNSAAPSAPRKEARGISPAAQGARDTASSAANPAPALTPMMLGAARGFPNTPWMMVPAAASAAPARRQPQVRGRRA